MVKHEAYLDLSSDKESDECLTPRYGVMPIVKYLKAKGYKIIWCPFDKENSMFVRVLKEEGFIVIESHIDDINADDSTGNFFFYEPYEYDCIVSNPPFSIKDEILERLYKLDKPFAMILPLTALQSLDRVKMFMENGIECLCFNRRICYYTRGNLDAFPTSNRFTSAYFCKDVLPEKLQFEEIAHVQEPYYDMEDMF